MGDVVIILDYWHDFPPSHLVLKAAFLKDSGHRSHHMEDEQATIAGMRSLLYGNSDEGIDIGCVKGRKEMPEYLRSVVEWGDSERAKMVH